MSVIVRRQFLAGGSATVAPPIGVIRDVVLASPV
jgi:hypothetical protein